MYTRWTSVADTAFPTGRVRVEPQNPTRYTASSVASPSMRNALLIVSLLIAFVGSACSSGISASSCDEVVDVTIDLIQRLIDDVDEEFGELSVEEFISSGGDLPSIERFTEDAATIDEIAADLGCSQTEITAGVDARVDELTSETELGSFLIRAIRSGGL